MVQLPDIDRLMAGDLGVFLAEQRGARVEAKAQAWSRGWKAALIAGPIMLLGLVAVPIEFGPKLWACAFAIGLIAMWVRAPIVAAKKRVKVGINEGIAGALGLAYEHDREDCREFALAHSFGLVPRFGRKTLEDFWEGELEGTPFLLHEAHLEERRGSGKNRRWVTIFRGAIIRIGGARRFHGTTLVQRAGRHKSWFGGRKDTIRLGGQQLDLVDMVHPDFDDTFEVWSSDQVEARYLVHPLYVERLLAIEAAFSGKAIRSLFTGGDIVIAVDSGNLFESGTMDADRDRAMVERCAAQFGSLGRLAQVVNETRDMGA